MTITNIVEQLRRDEGEVLSAYQDSLGYWTIGVGHLIDARRGGRIPAEISAALLEHDLVDTRHAVDIAFPWAATTLDPVRYAVLLNMAFNMGVNALSGFHVFLTALRARLYYEASDAMLASAWFRQVGARAQRLAAQIRTGEWQ